MKDSGPLPMLAVSVLTVAVMATVMVKDGWVLFIPALLALAVVGFLAMPPGRR